MINPKVTIYTDGSWKGRYKSGGYAAFLTDEYGNYMLIGQGIPDTTIARMELSAVVVGLSCLNPGCDVIVVADSMYVVNIINDWISRWITTDFKRIDGSEIFNRDIIDVLVAQINRMHSVKAIHVKSHTGRKDINSLGNDLCDYYAQYQADRLRLA